MRESRRRTGAITLGCLMSVLFIAALLYFGIPAAEVYVRARRFQDALAQETRLHGKQPDYQIRAHMVVLADSLGMPPEAGKVDISRKAGRVTISSEYEEMIHLPGRLQPVVFRPSAAVSY